MENESNEHRKDTEGKANFIRAQARERLESKRVADKKGKDYTFSDNFPKNLDEYKAEKNNRHNEIQELEAIFILFSDDTFNIANRYRNGELRFRTDIEDLREELKDAKDEIRKLYSLNKEYFELTKNKHPNYDKYVAYMSVISNELDKEITLRNKMLGGFEGKVFK